ncbi:MAG: hypothetical protein AVDCRST_MAG10-2911, partial [uncultured Acidimicrobiales bacterium]
EHPDGQRYERNPPPALSEAVPPVAPGRRTVPRLRAAGARPAHGDQGCGARRPLPLPAGHGEGGDGLLLVGAVAGGAGPAHLRADRAGPQGPQRVGAEPARRPGDPRHPARPLRQPVQQSRCFPLL